MCLIIETLPASQRDSNCVPCFKAYDLHFGKAVTPYQRAVIPLDGILTVGLPVKKRVWREEIHGGAIHAYCQRGYFNAADSVRAYAFGVIAYGHYADLACSLLYIPFLDNTHRKDERMRQIRKWRRCEKGPTNREVKRLFPNFIPPIP